MDKKVRKRDRRTIILLIILTAIPIVLFVLRTSNGYLAGAKMDWLDQHSVFPDYFRKLFYKTGNLFPQYAAELGGGQNIYNFAYYGLFNPLYLLSYLLPFVKMSVYIQGISLLEHIADGILCFFWLRGKKYSEGESFFASSALILAAPITFHTATQLMFVNYMPFLILALIGYDRYCKKGKYGLLTVSVLMMILNSFYFAVGGMAVLFIYGVTEFTYRKGTTPVQAVKWLWHQFYPALLGCLLSLFYLAPVYFAMSAGRDDKSGISLKELFLPDVNTHRFLYHPYGLGVSVIVMVIMCTSLFYKRCREKKIAALMLFMMLIPLFNWLLNGGLYLRNKAFIPFLPLAALLIASFLKRIREKEITVFQAVGGYLLAAVLIAAAVKKRDYGGAESYYLYIDFAVCAAILILALSVWKRAVSVGMLAVMCTISIVQIFAFKDKMVPVSLMNKVESPDIKTAVSQVLKKDKGLYRTEVWGSYDENKANQNRVWEQGQNLTTVYSSVSNSHYQQFRNDILNLSRPGRNSLMEIPSDNPVFLRVMGVRYIVGNKAPLGYEKIEKDGNVNIYENKNTAPIAYVTDQTIEKDEFLGLSYPERQMALLEAAVTENGTGNEDGKTSGHGKESVRPADVKIIEPDVINAGSTPDGEGIHIKADRKYVGTLALDSETTEDQYFFLTFDVKNNCSSKDMVITVNGERNKLSSRKAAYYNGNTTFHYASSIPAGTKEIPVEFGSGDYEISGVKAWMGTESQEKSSMLYRQPAKLNILNSGNVIKGTARSDTDGWMITSIPYDDGFQIYVDGKRTEVKEVNMGFIGVPLTKGHHTIRMVYRAEGRNAGMLITLVTLGIIAADYFRRKKLLLTMS